MRCGQHGFIEFPDKETSGGGQYCILAVCLYAGMDSVNYLAVQGRGYTLATTLYLISLCCLYQICISEYTKKRHYIIFSISLTAGLYTLASSVYWVLPTCIAGGFILLMCKKIKILLRLIVASVVAAVNTVIIYSIVWLAIGSNLLQDDPSLATYGKDHLKILFSDPLRAWIYGRDYMASSPFVQGGVPLQSMAISFVPYWKNILNGFYPHMAYVLFAIFLSVILFSAVIVLKRQKYSDQDKFLSIYLTCAVILIPLIMFLQRIVPYDRVYSFAGVPTALSVLFTVSMISRFFRDKIKNVMMVTLSVLGIMMLYYNLSNESYNRAYGRREDEIWELLKQDGVSKESKFFLIDEYQQLLLCFYYREYQEVSSVEEADVLMMPLESTENVEFVGWPIYYPFNYFDWEYIEREFDITYENEGYLLYQRKEEK